MDRQSPREKQPETNRTVVGVAPAASSAVAMATASSGSAATCTQTSSAALSLLPPDRQAVQVIQHAVHRPPSMTAQYLHQMYAAQQHHIMLQTAALQQQHQPHLQSLASIQQASVCQRQTSSSSSSSSGVAQNSIAPVAAQLISRTQASNSGAATTSISQQAMLLGNRPANCNQAQMYLRTQMLILTPAATVATVPSDLPAVTASSSSTSSSQVQNLALRAHLPGALATAHGVILKPSTPSSASVAKTSAGALRPNQHADAPSEKNQREVTRGSSGSQVISPAYSPMPTHALVKQQLSGPFAQRVAHHQLILQQGASSQQRQLHPIALRVTPQDPQALPLSLKRLSAQSDTKPPSSTSAHSDSSHPQPPPLVAAPQRRTLFSQAQSHPPPPPPPLVQPKMPQNPPSSLHRPFLQSVSMQSGQLLLTEQELPVAEALIQMPYQNLPPPQTVAVDLKVVKKSKPSSPEQTVNGTNSSDKKEECTSQKRATPTEVTPKQNGAVREAPPTSSSPSVTHSPPAEAPIQPHPSSNRSNPPPPTLPPAVLPAPVRGPSQPASAPASLPASPGRVQGAQILTHLIEGFVIREGLEPFPVVQTSVLADQQASLPEEDQENHTNGDAAAEDSPVDADQSDSSDSEMEDDAPAADAVEEESPEELLQCEFCGGKGYADTFLKSKRFCSVSCGKRYSVSYTKRFSLIRAGRWGNKPMGRRGRPPSRVNGASREHFLKQLKDNRQVRGFSKPDEMPKDSTGDGDDEEEAESPAPMATRLRTQAERAKRREEEQEQRTETITLSDGEEEEEGEEEEGEDDEEEEQEEQDEVEEEEEEEEEDAGSPSKWNVEQVFSFINSLPGGQEVAQEFRSQEIDGQALLLLTEDHLVSSMNLKLGPALKLCAHINALKDKN